jgi:hypothetical protein
MSPAEAIALTVGAITIFTALMGGLFWLIRAVVAMQKEFKPNGGSSTRDQLIRIENDIQRVADRLEDHIDWHMDRR